MKRRYMPALAGALLLCLPPFPGQAENSVTTLGEDCADEALIGESSGLVSGHTGTIAVMEGDLISLHGGMVIFERSEVPALGDPATAKHLLAGIFDYTCGHCRNLRNSMYDIQRNYGGEVAVIQLPGTRADAASREMHRMMLTLFRADKPLYEQMANGLYFGAVPPEPGIVRTNIINQWGEEKFNAMMNEHGPAVMDILYRTRQVMDINAARTGTLNLPQLMVGGHIAMGSSPNPRKYLELLAQHLGLEPRAPALQPLGTEIKLGRVYAGSLLGFEIPLANVGNAPLILGQLMLPQGSKVEAHPSGPIPPGEMKPIKLKFPVPTAAGDFESQMRIVCNTMEPPLDLLIKGEAWAPLLVDPVVVRIAKDRKGEVSVKMTSSSRVGFGTPFIEHPALVAEIIPKGDDLNFEMKVRFDPSRGIPVNPGILLPVKRLVPEDPWPETLEVPVVLE